MTGKLPIGPTLGTVTVRARVLDFVAGNFSIVSLAILIVVSTMMSPHFLTTENVFNVLRQWTMVGLLAIGMVYVIMTGGIDLSGGSILALSAVSGAILLPLVGTPLMILIVPLIGAACGYVNGAIITWGRVPPFIATLGMMTAARGLALTLCDGRTIQAILPPEFVTIFGRGYLGPIPVAVLLTGTIFILAGVVLKYTRYGRNVALVGDNELGAHRAGIQVDGVKRGVYVLSGTLASVAGLIFLGRLGVGEPTAGVMFELSAIAAVVIGGTPFIGGSGSVLLTFIGLAVIALTYNILNLLSVTPYAQDIARGTIIVIAVVFSMRRITMGKNK